jgi:hypothetical protein
MFPDKVAMELDAPSPEKIVCSFIFVYQSLQKEPYREKKPYSYSPRNPRQTEFTHTMGYGLVPQGDR